MAHDDADPLATMVKANDKLLKALITLLAMKDEHLLDEMRAVFLVARRDGNPVGLADKATHAHIRKELLMITDLLDHDSEIEAEEMAMRPDGLVAN